MSTTLNLSEFVAASQSVPERSATTVLFHLIEELGEVSVCINRPHKADESLAGELADVINCTLDIGMRQFGELVEMPDHTYVLHILSSGKTSRGMFLSMTALVGALAYIYEEGSLLKRLSKESLQVILYGILAESLAIYVMAYGDDYSELQTQINKKCAKWRKVAGEKL